MRTLPSHNVLHIHQLARDRCMLRGHSASTAAIGNCICAEHDQLGGCEGLCFLFFVPILGFVSAPRFVHTDLWGLPVWVVGERVPIQVFTCTICSGFLPLARLDAGMNQKHEKQLKYFCVHDWRICGPSKNWSMYPKENQKQTSPARVPCLARLQEEQTPHPPPRGSAFSSTGKTIDQGQVQHLVLNCENTGTDHSVSTSKQQSALCNECKYQACPANSSTCTCVQIALVVITGCSWCVFETCRTVFKIFPTQQSHSS